MKRRRRKPTDIESQASLVITEFEDGGWAFRTFGTGVASELADSALNILRSVLESDPDVESMIVGDMYDGAGI